ncbi:MAG: peptidoglycan DD-metalloendopeptidase family protein [Bdellovibrionales bacterium]|nr:peptidoglycan DD-metalloendopeptidase family protein [Bdellovibrionales bacterium]
MSLRGTFCSLFSKQFCLWLVPAGSGTVRKVRFSARRALFFLVLLGSVSFGLLWVAGDYARVQFARVQEALSLADLRARHTKLSTEAEELAKRVLLLRKERDALETAQDAVRGRVIELHAVLSEMKAIGVLDDFEIPLLLNSERADGSPDSGRSPDSGIGGGDESAEEIDTEEARNQDEDSGIGGLETPLDGDEEGEALKYSSLRISGPRQELISELDQIITRIRKLPIGYPGNGYVNSQYGPRRSPFSGQPRVHKGVDIALPYGSYVQSTAEGEVESVKNTRSYGLVIDVRHANGVVTRYAHLSQALVQEGEKICRGEYLGLVGNSGMSTGPHLHYEIRVRGKAIDPLLLMEIPSKINFATNL